MNLADQLSFLFELLGTRLPESGVPFVMIGGHAVNYYGYTRATMDIDLMIAAEDAPSIRDLMKASGFSNVSEAENVIFFSHPKAPIRVDFLPVDRETMRRLLDESIEVPYGGGRVRIPALKDLLAMKLFSAHNGSPLRKEKDFADVVQLVFENGLDCETDLKPLCEQFASAELYTEIVSRLEEMNDA